MLIESSAQARVSILTSTDIPRIESNPKMISRTPPPPYDRELVRVSGFVIWINVSALSESLSGQSHRPAMRHIYIQRESLEVAEVVDASELTGIRNGKTSPAVAVSLPTTWSTAS